MPSSIPKLQQTQAPMPAPAPEKQLNPLNDNSKAKQFTQRTDVLLINIVYDC
jgi:hypothetical protein